MQYGKYTHVLALLATIPVPILGEGKIHATSPVIPEDAAKAFDHLFEYIHANFPEPVTSDYSPGSWGRAFTPEGKKEVDDCRAMLTNRNFSSEKFAQFLETIPPYFSEVLFPVCVARYMLRELRMPIQHRMTIQFVEFHRRYGTMILSA